MDYKVNIFLRMSWIDKRLQFEVNVVKCILWSVYSLNLKRGINYLSIFVGWELSYAVARPKYANITEHSPFNVQNALGSGFDFLE